MFRTGVCRAISPSALWLRKCTGKFRGTNYMADVWRAYAALSVDDRKELSRKAATMSAGRTKAYRVKQVRKLKKRAVDVKRHGQNPYANFVKANYKTVQRMPANKRLKAIAKLWKESKNK
jgi:hypothetical protein